jgi:hypothetical protein
MTTNHHRESATIYQFPVGGRGGFVGHRDIAKQAAHLASARHDEIVVSGSWYHEEAVREAELSRNN